MKFQLLGIYGNEQSPNSKIKDIKIIEKIFINNRQILKYWILFFYYGILKPI